MKRNIRQDLYIQVLKFISGNDNEASMNEISDGLQLNETERALVVDNLLYGTKVLQSVGKRAKQGDDSDAFTLTFEGSLKLLSYLELEQAKISSKHALWTAIIAISLTLVAILVDILLYKGII